MCQTKMKRDNPENALTPNSEQHPFWLFWSPFFVFIVFSSRVCLSKSPGIKTRRRTEHGEQRAYQRICNCNCICIYICTHPNQEQGEPNKASRNKATRDQGTETSPSHPGPTQRPGYGYGLGQCGSPIAGAPVCFFGHPSCRTNPAGPASYFMSGPMAAAHFKVVPGSVQLT